MKNPKRATFVKQLNQANQMQVNNEGGTKAEIQKKIQSCKRTIGENTWRTVGHQNGGRNSQ
jgi:hypothetical protein